MPTPDLKTQLAYCKGEMLNAFNEASKLSPFRGLVAEKRDPAGIVKFALSFIGPAFRVFTGEAQPVGLDAANFTVETVKYKNPVSISKSQLDRAKGIMGDELIMRPIRKMGGDALYARDAKMAALLEANGNDGLGSAFFATAATLRNSNGVTLTNTVSGTGNGESATRTDFYSGIAAFNAMKNVAGWRVHGDSFQATKPIILYPAALQSVMEGVFMAQTLSLGGANTTYNRAELRMVGDLTDTTDWFIVNARPTYMPFMFVDEAEPDFKTNLQNGDSADAALMLRDEVIFNSDYSFECAFGSRLEIVRVVNS